jgi:hypothetical protein
MKDNKIIKIFTHFTVILFFVLFSAPLFAQTAAELEELLQTKTVSYAQAARFVLEAADTAALKDANAAFAFAVERAWLSKNASAEQAAKLDGIAFLLMRVFAIKGGIWYSLAKNPHYAYRELVYQDIIQGKTDPEMTLTGEQFLFIVNRLLTIREGKHKQ